MSRLQIIDPAELPKVPISPKKKVLLLFSFVLGLGLGVGIAFFLEYIDDSIKLKEDVEEYLSLTVIGAIPKIDPFKVPAERLNGRGKLDSNVATDAKKILALESARDNPDNNSSSIPIAVQDNGDESNDISKHRRRCLGTFGKHFAR